MLWIIHHWVIPVFGALTWFGMLWAMLGVWLAKGQPRYPWQDGPVALISDVGATGLQPLFIAGSSVMAACFILAVSADRLLRHQSRLPRNMRQTERVLSYLAITGSVIGGAGIILVSCFNTNLYPQRHRGFLLMFIVGVALSAIFTTIEYRYLDVHHAEHQAFHGMLKASYIFKIVIVSVEVALAVAFGVTLYKHVHTAAAVLEWAVSFIFTFYLLSFAVDLWPAAHAVKGDYTEEAILHHEAAHGGVGGAGAGDAGHVELGHTGGGTAVAFGRNDAQEMRQAHYQQEQANGQAYGNGNGTGAGGHGLVAMRHFDDNGNPQRAT